MAIYEFDGYRPVVHESAFVHPHAAVTGNVVIGRDVYVGPGAAIRADWGEILIADGCNVQEGCVIHVFPGATVTLDESAHIGHGAIIHGATIGRNTLVGMNAVVMDRARVGAECVVGALTFVTRGHEDSGPQGRRRQSGARREGRERRDARVEDGGHASVSASCRRTCERRGANASRCVRCRQIVRARAPRTARGMKRSGRAEHQGKPVMLVVIRT